jgi:hypothetical protein
VLQTFGAGNGPSEDEDFIGALKVIGMLITAIAADHAITVASMLFTATTADNVVTEE